jgi:hypothetical protein
LDCPITHADHWYCCLNPAEHTAVDICVGQAGPITYFVLKTLFDASFLLAFEGNASNRREIFVENWGLTLGTVPPEDPEGIEVYYLDVAIWDEIRDWVTSPAGTCPDGCKIREFSS